MLNFTIFKLLSIISDFNLYKLRLWVLVPIILGMSRLRDQEMAEEVSILTLRSQIFIASNELLIQTILSLIKCSVDDLIAEFYATKKEKEETVEKYKLLPQKSDQLEHVLLRSSLLPSSLLFEAKSLRSQSLKLQVRRPRKNSSLTECSTDGK